MKRYKEFLDMELMVLLASSDELAYTEIFERYSKLLIAHAYRLLGDKDEASDVVQDVFMVLWQNSASLELKTSLSSYLYVSVRNKVLNRMSHAKVVAKYADSILAFMENADLSSDEVFLAKELEKLIESEINALPEKMREVFLLRKQEELSYTEISERLGITDKTAKQQVHNAVKILRNKINSFLFTFLA